MDPTRPAEKLVALGWISTSVWLAMIHYLATIFAATAGLLMTAPVATGQPPPPGSTPPGNPARLPPATPTDRNGPGTRSLPADQQAAVDRIILGLQAENAAVELASSNVSRATFAVPLDKVQLSLAHQQLTRARSAWAAKASQLLAESRASGKNLGPDALARLVQLTGGSRPTGRVSSANGTNAPPRNSPPLNERARRPSLGP